MDEPGEHLDAQTADSVLKSLFEGGGNNRGLMVVTHRLTGLEDADQVIVLRPTPSRDAPATVGASGTHAELLTSVPDYRWAAQQERT